MSVEDDLQDMLKEHASQRYMPQVGQCTVLLLSTHCLPASYGWGGGANMTLPLYWRPIMPRLPAKMPCQRDQSTNPELCVCVCSCTGVLFLFCRGDSMVKCACVRIDGV